MKKYWKSTFLLIVTVICIGTFYIHSSLASKPDISIDIQTINGNEEEIKKVVFYADYQKGNDFNSVHIKNGTGDISNQYSLLDELKQTNLDPKLKQYIKDYKSFMRGKVLDLYKFYEDDYVLAYANVDWGTAVRNYTLELSVLNKESEKVTNIKSDIPNKEKYSHIYVEDLQVLNGQLKILVTTYLFNGQNEVHVYSYDIANQKLVHDELVFASPSVEQQAESVLGIIYEQQNLGSQKYYIIHSSVVPYNMKEKIDDSGAIKDVILYNIETNEKEKLEIDGLQIESANAVYDSTVYFINYTEENIEVTPYSIEEKKVGKPFKYPMPKRDSGENPPSAQVAKGKLYIIQPESKLESRILIIDLSKGETLYEGTIQLKTPPENKEQYEFRIFSLETF